jgi:hypothetical protein
MGRPSKLSQKPKRKIGRPSIYSEALADRFCARLMAGESMRSICEIDGFPAMATVLGWLRNLKHPFHPKYARAREVQAEVLADQMQEIADDGTNDWMERKNADGEVTGWQLNGEAVARSKLRLEQRRWYAEKLLPKKYGAKLELAGSVDLKRSAADMTDAELMAIAAGRKRADA